MLQVCSRLKIGNANMKLQIYPTKLGPFLLCTLLCCFPALAVAQVSATGDFIAVQVCEANKKLKSENPGNIQTEIGRTYELRGLNRNEATHYWIKIPEAPVTEFRWVDISCGSVEDLQVTTAPSSQITVSGNFTMIQQCDAFQNINGTGRRSTLPAGSKYGLNYKSGDGSLYQVSVLVDGRWRSRWVERTCGTADLTYDADGSVPIEPDSFEHTLAASWQPGFCSTRQGSNNAGCNTLEVGQAATKQFSLHGLWADDLDTLSIFPCNCHLPTGPTSCTNTLDERQDISIPQDLVDRLYVAMPGSRGEAGTLELHEWTKHGTCHEKYDTSATGGADDDEYFEDSLNVLAQLNVSSVGTFFADNIGKNVTSDQILGEFDLAFGDGAGDRVQILCAKSADGTKTVIQELYIGMRGHIDENSNLGTLILAAPPLSSATTQAPCAEGLIVEWVD